MPDGDYEPRGRTSTALLIGVHHYDHDENLPGVRHNLSELDDVLSEGGVFHEVRRESPRTGTEFLQCLERDLARARGLFLLYFAGHGRAPHDGRDLILACGRSERYDEDEGPTYTEAVSWSTDVLPRLRNAARRKQVDQIVVVLDCCFAGNALRSFGAGDVHAGSDRISVLTSVQVNRRIPAGDGSRPTPYTEQLVRLLRAGVEEGVEAVRVVPLAKALRQAMRDRRTVEGDVWWPRYHRAETDREVVIGLRTGFQETLRERVGASVTAGATSLRAWLRRKRDQYPSLVPWLVAASVLVAASGGYGVYQWVSGGPACAPPLELRLLTDPDVAPTVQKAVSAYLVSPANHGSGGCRRSDVDVESPKATDAVNGLQRSLTWQSPQSSDDFQPQRDIGAQPDVWIPGSTTSYDRASNGEGPVTLKELGPLAYSPLVLAVPSSFPQPPAHGTGQHLSQLLATVRAGRPGTVLLRADPEYADSAQLATVTLYGGSAIETPASPAEVRMIEQQTERLSPAPRSSYELMQELAGAQEDLRQNAAVLLPEQVMAQFNDTHDALDRLGVEAGTLGRRVPLYPDDLGQLDLPFVQVTWSGAQDPDAQARQDAVKDLHTWLAGPGGQDVFTSDGYRGLNDDHDGPQAPTADSWLVKTGGAVPSPQGAGYRVAPTAVTAALARYRQGPGPGRVVYLLDASTSMDELWRKRVPQSIISQSLAGLGPHDYYGLSTVAGKGKASMAVIPYPHQGGLPAARTALGSAKTVDADARPADAVQDALNALAGSPAGSPQLIVYVTDDEDDPSLAPRAGDLAKAARTQGVQIDWVALGSGGCGTKDSPAFRLADGSGGRCLDDPAAWSAELYDEIALVGTGDTRNAR